VSLAERIRDVLALDPAAGAIEFEGKWHSFGELRAIADALDDALSRAGIGADAPVGCLLRNHPALIGAVLGLLATQRCVVTLNPHQGDTKLAGEIESLHLPAVIGWHTEWERFALVDAARRAGSFGLELTGVAAAPLRALPGLEQRGASAARDALPGVAIEMLTSGTTGPPKRIPLLRSSLEHSIAGALHYEKRGAAESKLSIRSGVAILNAPLVHVAGIWRALLNLAEGRRIALLERFEVAPWLDLVARHGAKTASLVPTAIQMLLEADVDKQRLASIAAVVSGTAPLSVEVQEAFQAKYGIPVLTTYGATEFAGGVAGWTLPLHKEWFAKKRGSVGRAHPGCELRLVDRETGAVLGLGETGLLEVRSPQLGDASRWARTTDLAELDADGFLWIRGRADDAILRGGFKIIPAEVAAVLERHPSVREASVVGLPDERLGQLPVAAVELRDGTAPVTEEALRDFAREHLARYQVPAEIRIVAALPRTPSMKVSRPEVRALFAPGASSSR
jgi:acyl-CoA synthetase (AMP-forming)/AMP-acid ligase II